MSKNNKIQFNILILFFFLSHIFLINIYPVNFEFAFVEAHNFIMEDFDEKIMQRFFDIQANSFLFSFFISLFSFFFPFLEPIYIGKILSAFSIILIGLASVNLMHSKKINYKNDFNKNLFIIITILNPLIWVFSYRATPDVISMAIAFYGFSTVIRYTENSKLFYFGAFLIGLATAMKVLTGIYFIASLLLINLKNYKKNIFNIFLFFLYYSIVPLIYYLIIYTKFNFFLFSPYYEEVLSIRINILSYLNNFILYSSFLFVFIFPIIILRIIDIIKKTNSNLLIINSVIYILFFTIGFFFLKPSVEMSFGYLSQFINNKLLNGILTCCFYSFYVLLYFEIKENFYKKNFLKVKLFCVVIIYLVIISLSLPSQRYLVIIIPVIYFLLSKYFFFNTKINVLLFLLICIPINSVLIANHYLTGSATKEILNFIKEKKIINQVCPSAIASHSMHEFPEEVRNGTTCSEKNIHIISGNMEDTEKTIFSVSKKFLFIGKNYNIINIR